MWFLCHAAANGGEMAAGTKLSVPIYRDGDRLSLVWAAANPVTLHF